MMEFKANIKNIDLNIETFSDDSATLVQTVKIKDIQDRLSQQDSKRGQDQALFVKYLHGVSELSTLPKYTIGDHQRLMQATANLIQNAIQFQTNNGSVKVIVAFDNQE